MKLPRIRSGKACATGSFRIRRVDYPAGLEQPVHTHDTASVTVLLGGSIRESTPHGEEIGSALSVVVKPPGVRHADRVGPGGARTLQVAFAETDLARFEGWVASPRVWRWVHGGPGARSLLTLAQRLQRGELPEPEVEDLVLEALANVDRSPPEAARGVPGWLLRTREAIDDDPFGECDVTDLARRAGVHPASLSRAFRREFGGTITDYRRRVRLRRAAALMTRAGAASSLSGVAHGAGYADHPHMCREFRELAGISPSALRRLAGQA